MAGLSACGRAMAALPEMGESSRVADEAAVAETTGAGVEGLGMEGSSSKAKAGSGAQPQQQGQQQGKGGGGKKKKKR